MALLADLRHGARVLRRRPAVTLVAAGSLALGIGVGTALFSAAPALLPPGPVVLDFDVRLDGRALAVAGLLALVATVIGGAVPAFRASRVGITPSLRTTAEALTPRRLLALPTALVALQVALAVVALNTAGLLLGSFAATRSVSRGFDTDRRILVLELSMGDEVGDLRRFSTSLESLRERALGLPGVRSATYVRACRWGAPAGAPSSRSPCLAEADPPGTSATTKSDLVTPRPWARTCARGASSHRRSSRADRRSSW